MAEGLHLNSPDLDDKVSKSDRLEKIDFEAEVNRSVQSVFKADDEFLIWGPASVEVVDKEGDKISVEALDKALPQLLKRARLSLQHTDQIVGRILESFKTEKPVTVEINDTKYERTEFPTKVLDLDDDSPAALFVAGEVFDDTRQAKRAREQIEAGDLTSYSISGEALVTRKQVEDGNVYDDVLDIDLSAVTLCEEGMNQGAAYSKVEGEVEDKELAGETSGDDDVEKNRDEVPSISVPNKGGQRTEAVNKNMTDGDTEKGEDAPDVSLEDVVKRLPEEGDLATKTDVEEAKSEAVEAFKEQALPEGDLATVKYVEQYIDEKFDEKGDDMDDEEMEDDEEEVEVEVETEEEEEKSPSAAEELANEYGVKTDEVEAALAALSETKGDEEDMPEEFEDEEEEEDIVEEEEDDEEFDDEEDFEDDEEDDFPEEEEDDGETVKVGELREKLPEDVWKVVSEYVDVPGDVARAQKDETEVDLDDVDDNVQKQVEAVLSGGGESSGGIPTGGSEDQVEKQYKKEEGTEDEDVESPALNNFY